MFDPKAATDALLASVPAAQRIRTNAYFDGNCWLLLWNAVVTCGIMLLLLISAASAKLRELALRITRSAWLGSWLYFAMFVTVVAVLQFPLTIYADFFREHQYGLSNMTFASWMRDQFVTFAIAISLGGLAFTAIWAFVRRARHWHIWAAAAAAIFSVIGIAFAPVFIEPLFNTYTPLADSPLKQNILKLARANGIPAHDVYVVNESRQSKRVSANVAGLFGTTRIALNDNLLRRVPPEGVLSVMGHEMGHYVLHHIVIGAAYACVIIFILFWATRRIVEWLIARYGARWRIASVTDLAAVPVYALVLTILTFLLTPIDNTVSRTQEYEADMYGLNAARQPDAEARVDLMLGEYRKLDPSPLQEFIFFDHPSGRTRIYAAMRWKAATAP